MGGWVGMEGMEGMGAGDEQHEASAGPEPEDEQPEAELVDAAAATA